MKIRLFNEIIEADWTVDINECRNTLNDWFKDSCLFSVNNFNTYLVCAISFFNFKIFVMLQ